jgi:hypothetical protein
MIKSLLFFLAMTVSFSAYAITECKVDCNFTVTTIKGHATSYENSCYPSSAEQGGNGRVCGYYGSGFHVDVLECKRPYEGGRQYTVIWQCRDTYDTSVSYEFVVNSYEQAVALQTKQCALVAQTYQYVSPGKIVCR